MLLGSDWDVAIVETHNFNLQALFDAGVLADLSGEEAIATHVAGMYAPIQDAVTKEGKLIGVPLLLFGLTQHTAMTVDTDTLAQLGMSEADKPTTFAEFAALCEQYYALDAQTRRGTQFYGGPNPSHTKAYFYELFISLYAAENRQVDGRVDFHTGAFQAGLTLCDQIAEQMSSHKPLYHQGTTVLSPLTFQLSNHWFENIRYGLTILTAGETPQCPATLFVIIVNASSPNREVAIDFVQTGMNLFPDWTGVEMMAQLDYDALATLSYDRDIAAQIMQRESQAVVDHLIQERDAGNFTRFYPEWTLEVYRTDIVPYLTFPYAPFFNAATPTQNYIAGSVGMDAFLEQLTQAVEKTLLNR